MLLLLFSALPAFPRPLAIGNVAVLSGPAMAYRRTEVEVGLSAEYSNPFDPDQVALDASVRPPSGGVVSVPGFFYRPYRRETGSVSLPIAYASTEAVKSGAAGKDRHFDKGEVLEAAGNGSWRVRFTPAEAGLYRIALTLRVGGEIRKRTFEVRVAKNPAPQGFVGIDPLNPRGFRLTTGQSYFPLGANLGWGGERGTLDYDDWLPEYGRVGANWGRVWLSPMWTTFALQQPGHGDEIDLGNAWRLDYVMDLARRNGVRLDLCIDSYNVLRDRVSWPEWERSPFNSANGGPVSKPSDFWTDPSAARMYRNKLRYIVARWGADPTVFSWEFWNEVDGVADYQAGPVREWHWRMAAYLHSIDPYRHLVSTSFGGNGEGAGDAACFGLPGIDYAVSHLYGDADGPVAVAAAQARLGKLGKPHFVAEFGADASGSRSEEDPTGMQLHDPLWASICSGSSAGAMLWWWDSFIHPRRLYPILGAASRFVKDIDWGKAHLQPASVRLDFEHPPAKPMYRDVWVGGGPVTWGASAANRPRTLRVSARGVSGGPVAGLLHGTGNHRDLHNPVTFETDLPSATEFSVEVGEVSGYGGAAMRVTIDGKVALDEKYEDPDGDRRTEPIKKYVGSRRFPLGAGKHTIVVENLGPDWVRADYRFKDALVATGPGLVAWGQAGPNLALVWVRQAERTWRNVIERKQALTPVPPSRLVVSHLRPGAWTAAFWDTRKGQIVATQPVRVASDGVGTVHLPAISTDLAVKLIHR